MQTKTYPYYRAGRPVHANTDLVVTNKYTGETAYRAALADARTVEAAIGAATEAFALTRRVPSFRRRDILQQVAGRVTERAEELARIVSIEVGKPIRDARGEVTRLIDTFRVAAGEAVRLGGEYLPLDISPRAEGYEGIWRRFPVGPCAFITPFNFPLNLVAHKIAPAIAAGCPFVLKPASATPISALVIGEILAETDWPAGAFSILPCTARSAEAMITDERIKLLSFTGSPQVGWSLKARAGKKKVVLELGGNAACIVDDGVDVESVADRLIVGAFYQSGQSCISVQRIIAHGSIYDRLKQALRDRAMELVAGDPLDEQTFLGPLISLDDAVRIEQWVDEAVVAGATVVCGGRRNGAFYDATILEHVGPRQKISCVEAFGPVATLQPFTDFKDAVRVANDSEYGLQAGVFTKNLDRAFYAFNELEVGGVIVNDIPSFRVDNMPYGGVKNSGFGREGVRYAMEEMTEMRLLVLRNAGRL
jgi:acyl-CoA reductase-like NAD-dependent aldehyde dehydrogenase